MVISTTNNRSGAAVALSFQANLVSLNIYLCRVNRSYTIIIDDYDKCIVYGTFGSDLLIYETFAN